MAGGAAAKIINAPVVGAGEHEQGLVTFMDRDYWGAGCPPRSGWQRGLAASGRVLKF